MAVRDTLLSSAVSFAHLQGITTKPLGKKSRADDGDDKPDDDDKKQQDGESDEDYAKRMEADDADPDDDGDDDESAEADDDDAGDDDKDKDKGAKKAKATAEFRRGVRSERRRTAAILGNKAFLNNPALAANLMDGTDMSAKAIVKCLRDSPAASAAHPHRAANNPQIGPSGAPTPSGPAAIESRWAAAFKRAGVLK